MTLTKSFNTILRQNKYFFWNLEDTYFEPYYVEFCYGRIDSKIYRNETGGGRWLKLLMVKHTL